MFQLPPPSDVVPLFDPSEIEIDNKDNDSDGEDNAEEIDDTAMPNNDFEQYTFQDFIRQADEVNVAQVQHRLKKDCDEKIVSLIGHEVTCKNTADGKVVWKHVESVTDDLFTERIEKEKEWLKNNLPMKTKIQSPKELFDSLWPLDMDDELKSFIKVVVDTNVEKKRNNQRLITPVSTLLFFF